MFRSILAIFALLVTGSASVTAQTPAPSSDDFSDLPPAVQQHIQMMQRHSADRAVLPATGSTGDAVQFVDPAEGAFSASVPAGWKVTGGAMRNSPMEPHYVIRAQSPDGGAQIFFDDPAIAIRQVPSRMTDMMGWREGMTIPAGGGVRLLLQRYRPGPQAAGDYVVGRLCPNATNFRGGMIQGETEQLMQEFGPIANAEGKQIRVDSGELSFQCGERNGYVYAVTIQAMQPGAPVSIWMIYRMAGYLATRQDSAAAAQAIHTLLGSFQMNPLWLSQFARECNDIAGNVIRESNAVTQATLERARQQDAERQSQYDAWKQNSDANFKAIEHTSNAITGLGGSGGSGNGHGYNAQLGTKEVCDDLDRCHPVDASVGTWYTDCAGNPFPGTSSGGPPPSSLSACWNPTH